MAVVPRCPPSGLWAREFVCLSRTGRLLFSHGEQLTDPMTRFSSLRFRLVGTVFLAVAPAWVVMYFVDKYYAAHYGSELPWTGFAVGLVWGCACPARARRVGGVFSFVDKYYAAHYGSELPWTGFAVGLVALGAA